MFGIRDPMRSSYPGFLLLYTPVPIIGRCYAAPPEKVARRERGEGSAALCNTPPVSFSRSRSRVLNRTMQRLDKLRKDMAAMQQQIERMEKEIIEQEKQQPSVRDELAA